MMPYTAAYFTFFLIFWWYSQGYFLCLYFVGSRKKNPSVAAAPVKKKFAVIVPTFNEAALIRNKIENLKQLDYPDFQVYFSDASQDATSEIISEAITGQRNFALCKSLKGRSSQINQALSMVNCDYVVITDADAVFGPDTLSKFAEILADEKIGVAGGCVQPLTRYKKDILFWDSQNTMRLAESFSRHSPVASGACYAFRRKIAEKIPDDVWADDIYIPFIANTQGFECVYAADILVKEVRVPSRFSEFFKDKMRKSQDNMKELLRFLPQVSKMRGIWLMVYLTRFTQVLLSPLVVLGLIGLAFFQNPAVVLASAGITAVSGLIQRRFFKQLMPESSMRKLPDMIKIFFITQAVLSVALAQYIVTGGKVRYERVAKI